jgi:hypothetical protein
MFIPWYILRKKRSSWGLTPLRPIQILPYFAQLLRLLQLRPYLHSAPTPASRTALPCPVRSALPCHRPSVLFPHPESTLSSSLDFPNYIPYHNHQDR